MNDIHKLASRVETLLAPYLTKGGISKAGKLDIDVGERLFKLYEILKQHLTSPAGAEVLTDFEHDPGDADTRAAFRHQLKKSLSRDSELCRVMALLTFEIEDRLEKTQPHELADAKT